MKLIRPLRLRATARIRRVLGEVAHPLADKLVISHGDLDGVAAAAIAWRALRRVEVRLAATVRLVPELVRAAEKGYREVYVFDLNPSGTNVEELSEALSKLRGKLVWIDHHEWSVSLDFNGFTVVHDTRYAAAELAYRYFFSSNGDKVSARLAAMARDDDFFLNRDELAVKWRRILHWYGWKARHRAVRAFRSGDLWPRWAEEAYASIEELYAKKLREAVKKAKVLREAGLRVAFIEPDHRLHPGDLHQAAREAGVEADLYAFLYPECISLRSSTVDVNVVAAILGGGGHRRAAGAPLARGTCDRVEAILKALREAVQANIRGATAIPARGRRS